MYIPVTHSASWDRVIGFPLRIGDGECVRLFTPSKGDGASQQAERHGLVWHCGSQADLQDPGRSTAGVMSRFSDTHLAPRWCNELQAGQRFELIVCKAATWQRRVTKLQGLPATNVGFPDCAKSAFLVSCLHRYATASLRCVRRKAGISQRSPVACLRKPMARSLPGGQRR